MPPVPLSYTVDLGIPATSHLLGVFHGGASQRAANKPRSCPYAALSKDERIAWLKGWDDEDAYLRMAGR